MKANRRTLLIGAAVMAVVVLWSAQQGRRPACAGGPCCPVIPGLSVVPSESSVGLESTNAKPGQTGSQTITNHVR
jgi:hypothetical protein